MTAMFPDWIATKKGGVKPGKFYALWLVDGLRYGFGMEREQQGVRILMLHNPKQAEPARTLPATVPALELQNAVITFEPADIQFGEAFEIPVGSLVLGSTRSFALVSKNGVVIDAATGAIGNMEEEGYVYYLERWKLVSIAPNHQPQVIFEFLVTASSA